VDLALGVDLSPSEPLNRRWIGARTKHCRRGCVPGITSRRLKKNESIINIDAAAFRIRVDMSLLDRLVGSSFASAEEPVQRVKMPNGMAVSGLDALGSVAYGPEAALPVLLPAGTRSFDLYCRSKLKTREERTASSSRSWLLRGDQQFLYKYSRGSPRSDCFSAVEDVSRSSKSFGDCLRHRPRTM
jgi:hypothetical protein